MRCISSWALLAAVMAPLVGAFAADPAATDAASGMERLLNVPISGLVISPQAMDIKNPYAGDKNAVTMGRKLFHSMNCVGCHAPEGGGGMGPPLSDQQWTYGGSPAEIYLTIMQGRPNGMPAWGGALPPQAIWSLVTYIETLQEPKPPYEYKTETKLTEPDEQSPQPAVKQPPQGSQKHPPPEGGSQ